MHPRLAQLGPAVSRGSTGLGTMPLLESGIYVSPSIFFVNLSHPYPKQQQNTQERKTMRGVREGDGKVHEGDNATLDEKKKKSRTAKPEIFSLLLPEKEKKEEKTLRSPPLQINQCCDPRTRQVSALLLRKTGRGKISRESMWLEPRGTMERGRKPIPWMNAALPAIFLLLPSQPLLQTSRLPIAA